MPKSTIIFALLSVALALATAGVLMWLILAEDSPGLPRTRGNLSIGLAPEERGQDSSVISSHSGVLWDKGGQKILFEQNGFERRPIASITKLMTAMVALDEGINWEQETTIEPHEFVIGGKLILFAGEKVTMRNLWNAMLVGSANNATLALVRNLGIPEKEFIREMNRKAIELGLEQTEFTDVTGLDPNNISTAYEVARLAETALEKYPEIAKATAQKEYVFVAKGSDREHTIKNSNKLISEEQLLLTGGKTGYLHEAQYCLVVQGSGANFNKVAVVLGSPGEWDSMQDIKSLLQSNYGGI